MSASTGTPATRRAPMRPSPRRPMSSRSTLDNHRIVMNPMEPRGGVGSFDAGDRPLHAPRLEPEHPHQPQPRGPLARRRAEGRALRGARCRRRLRRQELRLCRARADPVGGQAHVGRPVKWIASRSEVFLSDHAARDMQAEASLALDAAGKFLALRVASVANLGAYMAGAGGGVQTYQYIHLQGSVYRIPVDRAACRGGPDQHRADRRHARAGLRRGRQHHRTADRCRGAPDRLRSRRAAPPQHGAARRDADDQRLRLPGRQRPLRRIARPGAGARRRGGLRRAAAAKRGGAAGCAAWASPITSRPRAARRTRMSTSASRPTARCR